MTKTLKMAAASFVLAAGFSTSAMANAITSWECEEISGGQQLTLTTQNTVSSSAVVNIDGTALSASPTINGSSVSLTVPTSTQCWAVAFTITDGGSTFGLN